MAAVSRIKGENSGNIGSINASGVVFSSVCRHIPSFTLSSLHISAHITHKHTYAHIHTCTYTLYSAAATVCTYLETSQVSIHIGTLGLFIGGESSGTLVWHQSKTILAIWAASNEDLPEVGCK